MARRYFRAAAKPIGMAWQFAVGGDLNLPELEGPRPLAVRIINRHIDRLQTAAESDLVVAEQFTKVVALTDPPTRLLQPKMMIRVAATNLCRCERRQPAVAASETLGDRGSVAADGGNRPLLAIAVPTMLDSSVSLGKTSGVERPAPTMPAGKSAG